MKARWEMAFIGRWRGSLDGRVRHCMGFVGTVFVSVGSGGHLFCRRERLAANSISSLSEITTFSKDWYGTSRSFASALSAAIMETGSRSEIVRTEGFKLGKSARCRCKGVCRRLSPGAGR